MPLIEYCAPYTSPSGYGNFARNFIVAMHGNNIRVRTRNVFIDPIEAPTNEDINLCHSLNGNELERYDVSILNMTPELFHKYKKNAKINVGFTMFETDRIPNLWVRECNKMDAIFVPCSWNVDVFKRSGVTVPVYCVSPGLDFNKASGASFGAISGVREGDFIFYSIFQWTSRKNPEGLLRAYWAEFAGEEKVCLVLKTYGSNASENEQVRLKNLIAEMKKNQSLRQVSSIDQTGRVIFESPERKFPKILFIGDLLSDEQVAGLHMAGSCFVLPHRAEGWGMPHAEAMSFGKPVITTGFSGNMDFMSKENSMLLDFQMTPVCNMWWCPWYEGDMMWAEPDIGQLRKYMRYAFEYQDEIKKMGERGKKDLMENFSWQQRLSHLRKIIKKLLRG